MAEILPIRAWRYNDELGKNIEDLTSPLFDVVSDKQRKALYRNPHNSLHLSVPLAPNPAARAAKTLEQWKQEGVITRDPLPAIYVYYQYYTLAGSKETYCRKGFICFIRTYEWDENVILRHENTIPHAVNDRVDILEHTRLHASATHGLYTDPSFTLEKMMDEAIADPVYETEDYQGVRDVLAIIQDRDAVQCFINTLKDKTIILADGHHRYEGTLLYKQKRREELGAAYTGTEGFNYHLMYLTNTESGGLRILPTHRLISGLSELDEAAILSRITEDFIVKPVEDSDTLNEIIAGKQWAFGLLFRENAYKVRLKPESLQKMTWKFPDVVKQLDVTVMHYFIIERVLGIPGKKQRSSPHISFDRSFSDCLKKVLLGEAQLAIITNEISIEDVKKVCSSGYTMPQKSTYFYPKVICGFLFGSIEESEFSEPVYSPFFQGELSSGNKDDHR